MALRDSLLFLVIVLVLDSAVTNPCTPVASLDITDGIRYDNGSIVFEGTEYGQGEWYQEENENMTVYYGCPCLKKKCIWKCCGEGEGIYGRGCNQTDLGTTNSSLVSQFYDGVTPVSNVDIKQFHFMYNGITLCESKYPVSEGLYFLQMNGSLYDTSQISLMYEPQRYCMDYRIDNDFAIYALVCFPEVSPTEESSIIHAIYAGLLLVSVPFLVVTLLVYAFIPELRNLHGMCLMAYCSGLIIAFTLLAYLKLAIGEINVYMTGCRIVGYVVYLSFQTSFFWLNVMCFDIWRTFSGYRGGSSHKRRESRHFLMYGLYAWGVPLLLVIFTAVMDINDNFLSFIVRPNFGISNCWFRGWSSQLMYFYSPVLTLVVINIILFSITANRIRSIRQETAILRSTESSRSDKLQRNKQRYALYLKLFIVMGVNWTVEIIGFFLDDSGWYWMIMDLSNILLGVFVFMIFVWKNKVRTLVLKRLNAIRGVRSPVESSAGRWATRSSSAPTEDTRISADDSAMRLKDIH